VRGEKWTCVGPHWKSHGYTLGGQTQGRVLQQRGGVAVVVAGKKEGVVVVVLLLLRP
jgi:hypothetical protein